MWTRSPKGLGSVFHHSRHNNNTDQHQTMPLYRGRILFYYLLTIEFDGITPPVPAAHWVVNDRNRLRVD